MAPGRCSTLRYLDARGLFWNWSDLLWTVVQSDMDLSSKIKCFLGAVIAWWWSVFIKVLMTLEEPLLCGLSELLEEPRNLNRRMIIVLGIPRSGTTSIKRNLFKCE